VTPTRTATPIRTATPATTSGGGTPLPPTATPIGGTPVITATATATPAPTSTPLPLVQPKPVLACERALGRASTTLIAVDVATIERCGLAAFSCVQSKPAGADRDACIATAKTRCAKKLAALENARNAFTASLTTACGGDPPRVPFPLLLASSVLGFEKVDPACRKDVDLPLTSLGAIAACVQFAGGCRAECCPHGPATRSSCRASTSSRFRRRGTRSPRSVSSSGTGGGSSSATAPDLDTKQASTIVRVRDGTTVVLGGLIQTEKSKSEKKIPLLSDIPWLGKLFTGTLTFNTKKELVIFVTPHIVQ